MSYSDNEYIALSVIPHVTGAMSILGSTTVLIDILKSSTKLKSHQRLLLTLCVTDICSSTAFFLSTWPIPSDDSRGVFGAEGNQNSCVVQGFAVQFSSINPIYNMMLSINYVLVIKYGKTEDFLKSRVEPFMHLFALGWTLAGSISGLFLNLYHNSFLWCWIGPSPAGESDNNYKFFRWLFFYGPLWICIVFISSLMYFLYYTIHEQERIVARFNINTESRRINRSLSVAYQGIAFSGAFYLTWIPATIKRVLDSLEVRSPFVLLVFMAIFTPAQGFFNSLVYFRPKLIKKFDERRRSSSLNLLGSLPKTNDVNTL